MDLEHLLFDFIAQYVPLDEKEKQVIRELDIFKSVRKGAVLLHEGEKSNKGYFVLQGCLRVYYNDEGEEKTTAFYTEMEGVTPTCVMTGLPSQYYISATEDSMITESTPDMETLVFERFPKFERLCRLLSEDLLVKKQIDFDQFKTSSPEKRYLSLLEYRPDLLQRVPQHYIASYLGIKPQSLSRLRARIFKK